MSQNQFEKWTIYAFRHCNTPQKEEFYLHGGDVVRIKHAESGGYLTVDENRGDGNYEAYIRNYRGADETEQFSTNQMFEIEKSQDLVEESGTPLQWEEEGDTGEQTVSVRLRHFNSGRLLQINIAKDKGRMIQVLQLAKGQQQGVLEKDGEGVSAKKVLKMGGRIQNYVFKLTNRATVDEMTLTRETVCNIQNDGTKTFVSTEFQKGDGADAEDEEDEEEDRQAVQEEEERQETEAAPDKAKTKKTM